MLIASDLKKFGKLDRALTDPLREELKKINFFSEKYNRGEVALADGKLVEFPFVVQAYPETRKESLQLLELSQPIVDYIQNMFPDHVFMRGEISIMLPGIIIKPHIDRKWFHANSHRMHVPIITNDFCKHYFQNRSQHMEEDMLYELNNRIVHSAVNAGSETRTHLIFDLMQKDRLARAREQKIEFNRLEPGNVLT